MYCFYKLNYSFIYLFIFEVAGEMGKSGGCRFGWESMGVWYGLLGGYVEFVNGCCWEESNEYWVSVGHVPCGVHLFIGGGLVLPLVRQEYRNTWRTSLPSSNHGAASLRCVLASAFCITFSPLFKQILYNFLGLI